MFSIGWQARGPVAELAKLIARWFRSSARRSGSM